MALKNRDWLLLLLGVGLVVFLWAAPEESTRRVPQDEIHQEYFTMVKNEGKKTAEKFCEDCHNPQQEPLPAGHPPKARCLLCHKLEGQ
ncbi:MAG: cytochrome c [Desulfuromonadales bacterium]